MNSYSIKDLELISGIKAHTIRIWEKRYGILKPERTGTNLRVYNDDELRTLLNISVLVSNGVKISKVAKLSEEEMNDTLDQIYTKVQNFNAYADVLITRMIEASLVFDEAGFVKIYEDCIRRYGTIDSYRQVFYPLLVRIGLLWNKKKLLPAQEHFLSNLIRQKILATIDSIESDESNEAWLLFLPKGERHEIGMLFAYLVIKIFKRRTIYLGADVPYDDLKVVVNSCSPDYLYFFSVSHGIQSQTLSLLKKLQSDFKETKVCYSGAPVSEELSSNIYHLKEVDDLIEMVKTNE